MLYLCKLKRKWASSPLNHPIEAMKDRIRQIMESQHMTQTVFAQFIGMSPASLSSIFNERTKPSINIVEAIRKKITDINLEWLMFGSGSMYTDSNKAAASPTESSLPVQDSLFDFSDPTPSVPEPSSSIPENRAPVALTSNSVKSTHLNSSRIEVKNIDKPQRRVTEIRVFYDDQTWESFVPAKK